MRDGLCVLLLRVEAQGESLPRHVGLGMGGILLQKLLKASDGGRVELPVIGPVGEEVEIEGGILPLRLARRREEQRKEATGAGQRGRKSSSRHRSQSDSPKTGCHAQFDAGG